MGKRLPPDQMALYRYTDELLWDEWDPIGVNDVPEARDEYQGYLPIVFRMAMEGSSVQEIAQYLRRVESENMGLLGANTNCMAIARKIVVKKNELISNDG